MSNIAINGFGRIGRLLLRAHLARQDHFNVVAINDLMPIETAIHLLSYDSTHGPYPNVTTDGHHIIIGSQKIRYINEPSPEHLPWKDLKVDIVAECSGQFNTKAKASAHITQGAKRVLISAPCGDADKMVVFGINHKDVTPNDIILSNASCTTNALAPIIDVLHTTLTIQKGFLTTIHAYTADQRLVDAPHKDLRRARAATESMIPTSTGAARAIGKVFPDLQGLLDGVSVRVPTSDVSFIDLSVCTEKPTSAQEVNQALKDASENHLKNLMRFCTQPLVSKDFLQSPESVIVDSLMTQVIEHSLIKVFGWYDNEWGFSHRMCDMLSYLQSLS